MKQGKCKFNNKKDTLQHMLLNSEEIIFPGGCRVGLERIGKYAKKHINNENKKIMSNNVYIGIDPGTNGGIAVIDSGGNVIDVAKMPQTPYDIFGYLSQYEGEHTRCVLEDVGYGLPNQSSKATATFARHNGHIEMALYALHIATEKATPHKWIKTYQMKKPKDIGKTEWKNRLKAKAQQIFPSLGKRITLATCDALLIAEYARRKNV